MLRRLSTRMGPMAAGLAAAGSHYHAATTPSSYARRSSVLRTPRTSLAAAATAAASPAGGASSLSMQAMHAQLRNLFARPTACRPMRVQGRSDSVSSRDIPQQWGGGSSGGGSQADSLTPYVREHLFRVYTLLCSGCVVAGLGSLLMIATPLAKTIPFFVPMIGGFIPLLWLSFAPPANPTLKLALFYSFTLLEGMSLGPLILATSMKGVLVTSLALTGAIFGGFSAAAYLAPRASLVAWQGPLFGALLGLVALQLLSIFYPTAIAHSLILYGGLALFSVLIAVDTQAMIERARCGAGDHVQDALSMFLNLVNIFVRIAQIMGAGDS